MLDLCIFVVDVVIVVIELKPLITKFGTSGKVQSTQMAQIITN